MLAERLLERGDSLVLLARSTERAHDLRADLPDATVLVADLADASAVEAVADQLPDRSTRSCTPLGSSTSVRSAS